MSKYDECRDDFRRARERNDAKKVEDASRRQSAHDWYREQVEKGVTLPTLEEAHLAGQGCEEKRMADEIAALKADIERSNTSRLSEIMANNMVQREQAAEIAALRQSLTFETNRLTALWDNEKFLRERDQSEIAALKHNLEVVRENHRSLELHCANRETLLQSLIGLRNEQTTEIAALREAVRDLEYANAMFTQENKSFREAIIGMEGGLNIADSWRTHPTVLYVMEEKR